MLLLVLTEMMKRFLLAVSLLLPSGHTLYGPAVANGYGTAQPPLKNVRFWGLTIALWFLSICGLFGQLAFTSQTGAGSLHTQDFSGYTGGGFASSPAAGQLDSDDWIVFGLSDGTDPVVPKSMTYGDSRSEGDWGRGTSTGGINPGGLYGFDVGSGNNTLGMQATLNDLSPGGVEWRILNDTGSTITEIDIAYDIFVYNDKERGNSFNFSFFDDGGETLVSSLDFTSPGASSATPSWAMTARSATLNVNVADGNYIRFRWTTDDLIIADGKRRDEFGLDNVSAQVVPEPSTYALIFGGIALGVVLWKRRARSIGERSKEQRA